MTDEELRQLIILDEIRRNRHSFLSDLLANVSGNALWDAAVWLGSRLLRKL
jgi:hypothetical protein